MLLLRICVNLAHITKLCIRPGGLDCESYDIFHLAKLLKKTFI